MSRVVVNAGGFYSYVAYGLGRPVAVAAGLVAVIAYNAAVIGVAGALGYFANLAAASHGLRLPWAVWAGLAIVVMAYFGYRRSAAAGRTDDQRGSHPHAPWRRIVVDRGAVALPVAAVSPVSLFAPGLGVALMFALISYVGF